MFHGYGCDLTPSPIRILWPTIMAFALVLSVALLVRRQLMDQYHYGPRKQIEVVFCQQMHVFVAVTIVCVRVTCFLNSLIYLPAKKLEGDVVRWQNI